MSCTFMQSPTLVLHKHPARFMNLSASAGGGRRHFVCFRETVQGEEGEKGTLDTVAKYGKLR